jgi:hypothetical protein
MLSYEAPHYAVNCITDQYLDLILYSWRNTAFVSLCMEGRILKIIKLKFDEVLRYLSLCVLQVYKALTF